MDFIDMFCGVGAIRMGFEQAGHKCVYSIEWDKWKRKMYSIIFGGEPDATDIRTVDGIRLPRADCWCFGAPCQDFSIAGQRKGLEGDRSSLVREVFRLLKEIKEEHRPKYLLYENVKGMLSSNKGLDFLEILIEMESLGYDTIEYSLLDSKDFGVPQHRERVYTIGHLRRRGIRKVFPIGGDNKEIGIKELAKINPNRHSSLMNSVLDIRGISPTLDCMQGGGRQPKIMVKACLTPDRLEKRQNGRRFKEVGEPMFTRTTQDVHGVLITHEVTQMVTVRKNEVNVEKLKILLREHKKISNKEIAEKLEKPQTIVEHWFRNDECFSIPNADIWFKLKELLGIETVEFDKAITEFEVREGVFEKSNRVYDELGIAPTLTKTSANEKIFVREATKQGYAEANEDDSINLSYPDSKTRRGRVGKDVSQTLDCSCNQGTLTGGRIRRLTPKECWRLQGIPDIITDKVIAAGISDTQMYRGAGDACTVNVIYEIAKRLY